jgi:hypothetical protein
VTQVRLAPPTAAPFEVWSALLDAMEWGLESSPPVVVDPLPADVGPLPPVLRDRAVQTLRRMAAAEAELEAQRAEIARELLGLSAARTAAASTATPNVPHFLDTRA